MADGLHRGSFRAAAGAGRRHTADTLEPLAQPVADGDRRQVQQQHDDEQKNAVTKTSGFAASTFGDWKPTS